MLTLDLELDEEHEENVQDIMSRDLAGFRHVAGYYLEIIHNCLEGFFPAIMTETKEIVVSLDKTILEDLKKILPKRNSRIKELSLLANEQKSIAFNNAQPKKTKEMQLYLLTKKEFDSLKKEKDSFSWKPGLLSLT